MIVRDCLFHLSFSDINLFILNLKKSNIKYILTTTHSKQHDNFQNKDIITGDFRLIDLFSEPFNFSKSPLERIEDYLHPEPFREMCLFHVESLISIN